MTNYLKQYDEQTAKVLVWQRRLNARDALVTSINAELTTGTLEVLNPRTGSPPEAALWMDNRISNEDALWAAKIVGELPMQRTAVDDLRDLARELNVPIPTDAR